MVAGELPLQIREECRIFQNLEVSNFNELFIWAHFRSHVSVMKLCDSSDMSSLCLQGRENPSVLGLCPPACWTPPSLQMSPGAWRIFPRPHPPPVPFVSDTFKCWQLILGTVAFKPCENTNQATFLSSRPSTEIGFRIISSGKIEGKLRASFKRKPDFSPVPALLLLRPRKWENPSNFVFKKCLPFSLWVTYEPNLIFDLTLVDRWI